MTGGPATGNPYPTLLEHDGARHKLSALSSLIDPAIIDGTTEPDFTGTPIVELDGTSRVRPHLGTGRRAGRSRRRSHVRLAGAWRPQIGWDALMNQRTMSS